MNAPEQLMTQEELAFRWKVSEATLERDRSLKKGCRYLKLGGLIRYRLQDVLEYEDACVHEPAKKTAREKAAAQRQPLTRQQLIDIELSLRIYTDGDGYDLSLHDFARAIERAHGIGGEHD